MTGIARPHNLRVPSLRTSLTTVHCQIITMQAQAQHIHFKLGCCYIARASHLEKKNDECHLHAVSRSGSGGDVADG